MMKHNRRQFFASIHALPIAFPFAIQANPQKSRVVIAQSEAKIQSKAEINGTLLESLLDRSMKELCGTKEPIDAWKALFSSNDKVGIKTNALGGRNLSPNPQLALVISKRLNQIGIPAKNIFIWDRSYRELLKAGYDSTIYTDSATLIATDQDGVGYEPRPEMSGSIGSCFSRILSKGCTALINLGVLKHHDLSGISVAMKNLFGVIHNPNRYHFDVHNDPYLPDLCLHPYLKNTLRLHICDGFAAQYDGGPAYSPKSRWDYNGILVSKDPVALDTVSTEIIDKKRIENQIQSLKDVGRYPHFLQIAEEKKIGFTDTSKIEIQEITV
jgi:uncharacterized protein (DUF362 family)